MSEFEAWFEGQHGKRPYIGGTDAELVQQVNKGLWADGQLRKRQEWDARMQSALYAWQAKQQSERDSHG